VKKIGFLIFLVAIIGSIALVWAVTGKTGPSISFNFSQIKGSGNLKSEKRDVSGFRGIRAGGAMQIEIVAGKEFSVEIETDDNILPLIKTEVRGGVLHIEREGNVWTRSRSRTMVRISLPQLDELNISGATTANVSGVKSEQFELKLSGASKINIEGEAGALKVDLSGASKLDAENFRVAKADVEVSGASKANLFVSETLNADASGASKINYSGNPQTVTKDVSGASKISAN
jgi:hypothetical protein